MDNISSKGDTRWRKISPVWSKERKCEKARQKARKKDLSLSRTIRNTLRLSLLPFVSSPEGNIVINTDVSCHYDYFWITFAKSEFSTKNYLLRLPTEDSLTNLNSLNLISLEISRKLLAYLSYSDVPRATTIQGKNIYDTKNLRIFYSLPQEGTFYMSQETLKKLIKAVSSY